jgi:hypothetical protein
MQNHQVHLNQETIAELKWLVSDRLNLHNRMSLILPPFDLTISTDAFKKGWGAFGKGKRTGGKWEETESKPHIDVLELKAALLAIQSFLSIGATNPRHLELLMENSTAVAYLNKRGGQGHQRC